MQNVFTLKFSPSIEVLKQNMDCIDAVLNNHTYTRDGHDYHGHFSLLMIHLNWSFSKVE